MSRIFGYRQQRVQFFYDSLLRVRGPILASAAFTTKTLFAGASVGVAAQTNLKFPGMLTSDETFLVYAVRHEVYMRPTGLSNGNTAVEPGLAVSGRDLDTRPAGVFRDLLHHTTFELKVSDKIEFEGCILMTPAGGGEWGYIADSFDCILVNGAPRGSSIYVLPLPVAVAARQAIAMIETIPDIPAGGAAGTADIDLNTNAGLFAGVKIFRGYLDGFHSRDVL